ncbi:chitinase-3-like protein 1 [Chironomus tepperi]|uniref:chitinase-3-like protein 1 n=1 Tax=Chironomus tepperi TaxID=113505 RepID=UPI00391F9C01
MKFTLICCLLLHAAVLISAQKKVVCFWGTWAAYRAGNGKFEVTNIDPTICTHIIYSFMGAKEDGSVTYLDSFMDLSDNWGKGYIDKFIALRSQSPNTKFMMSIGGWNAGSAVYSKIAASASIRDTFAQNVLNMLNKHGFDGFDFDWEYPAQRDTAYGSADKANFVALLQTLKTKLAANGKLLTIAVAVVQASASLSYDIPNVAKNVDFINLMTYDLHGSWDGVTGINAPLYAGPRDITSYQQQLNIDAVIKYWLAQGAPKDKLIVGIPLYGNSFTLSNSSNYFVGAPSSGAGTAGKFVAQDGFLPYNEICYNIKNGVFARYWENTQKVPYAVGGNQWVGYDDAESIAYKVNYIQDNNLGGAMFWSIETEDFNNICGNGKFPLIKMTYQALIGNTTITTPTTVPPTVAPTTVAPTVGPTQTPTVAPTVAPTTTTTTVSPAGPFVCPGNGLFKNPADCNSFYNCWGGVAWLQYCQVGFVYNPNGYCDYPSNYKC